MASSWTAFYVSLSLNLVPSKNVLLAVTLCAQVPNLPMRPTFSLWTDTRQHPFGGPLNPSQGPWEEIFNNVRQVVCDRPAPATTPLGPSWMYA